MEVHQLRVDSSHQRTTIRIPINPSISGVLGDVWQCTKDAMAFFLEPLMDTSSLIDLSIALLLLECVGAYLQPYESTMCHEELLLLQRAGQLQQSTTTEDATTLATLLGSPAIALCGTFTLLLSLMITSSLEGPSSFLAPIWNRISFLEEYSSTFLMYLLLIMFCVESILILSIMTVACHALLIPQQGGAEEHLAMLMFLTTVWVVNLIISSFLRFSLYQSIGDWIRSIQIWLE